MASRLPVGPLSAVATAATCGQENTDDPQQLQPHNERLGKGALGLNPGQCRESAPQAMPSSHAGSQCPNLSAGAQLHHLPTQLGHISAREMPSRW